MKHICKKSLSFLLVLCMIVSLFAGLSITASADLNGNYSVSVVVNYLNTAKNKTETVALNDLVQSGSLVYTGTNKKPDPRCLAVVTEYVPLADILTAAGVSDYTGDWTLVATDGSAKSDALTLHSLLETKLYYAPAWAAAASYSDNIDQTGKAEVPTVLALKSFHTNKNNDGTVYDAAVADISTLTAKADEQKSPRFFYGQNVTLGAKTAPNNGNLGFNNVSNVTTLTLTEVAHSFVDGVCTGCGAQEPAPSTTPSITVKLDGVDKKTYSASNLNTLAAAHNGTLYFSGIGGGKRTINDSRTLAAAKSYVTVEELLTGAISGYTDAAYADYDIVFTATDNHTTTMTVGSLLGTTRYYYPAWLTAATYTDNITGAVAANAAAVPAVLTLSGYTATSDDNGLDTINETANTLKGCFATPSMLDAVCDATKAPRLLLGQKSGGDSTEKNLGGLSGTNIVSIELKAPVSHSISKAACTNGSFELSAANAIKGTSITVTTIPESGYAVESVLARTAAATETAENTYSFTMPDADVTVTVTFTQSTATTADTTWYNTTDASFTLSDAADLLGLASIVNGGNDFSGKTITLANDISLSGVSFTPIGTADHPFAGTFSGADKEISGLSVSATTGYTGLFGYNKGTIKDLTLSGTVTATGTVDFVGSVAGYNGGTITSVTSSVTVTAEDAYNVGGIAGFNDGGKNAQISTTTETGNSAFVTKSAFIGSVTGNSKVGGIAGENSGTVKNCYCSGTVDGTLTNSKNGVGGIVGRNGNNNTAYETGVIDSCYFIGTVGRASQKWVGGIAGFNNSLSTVKNCYMAGTLVAGAGTYNAIIGGNEGTASNNYALSGYSQSGTAEAEIGIAKTDAELKADTMVGLLNGADGSAWKANADGYPVLFWQSVTPSYDWNSTKWAGGLDFSWYDASDVKTSYHITTPAQWEALAWICSEHLADLADYATKTNGNVTAIKGTIPTAQNTFAGVQFYLDNDIDMGGVCTDGTWSGPNYYPIGSQGANDAGNANWYGSFYGSFNGQGHTVKNVYCNRGSGQNYQSVGLFGRVGESDTASRSGNPADYPNANADIVIENIAVTGYIKSGRSVGGIVGKTLHVFTDKTVTVRNCINFAKVESTDAKGVGGVVGALWNNASLSNCANFGTVNGANKTACTGGIVGTNDNVNYVSNSYNVGDITNSASGAYAGAICGSNNQSAKMLNCYYLADSLKVTGSGITVYGTSKTAAEMKSPAFAVALNTDNADAWTIPTDSEAIYTLMNTLGFAGYPVPKAFSTAAAPVSEVNVTPTVNEGTATAAVSETVSVTKDAPFTVSVKAADPTAVTKDEVSIPAAALETLKTAEEFTLEGNVGTISMPAAALSSIVTAAGSDPLSISVETKTAQAVTGVAAADLQDAAIVEINLTAGGKSITSFGTGNTITISIPAGANHEVGKTYKVIELSADGSKKILTGNCVKENGAKVLKVEVSGLSTFVGTASQAYSVAISADSTGIVGKDIEVKLAVSNGTATKFNSYDFTLTYDTTYLTYKSISLTGATVDSTTTAGTLYIRGCGADLNCTDPITVTFTGAAKGSAAVTLTAAKVDAADNAVNDALQATISKASATIGVKEPTVSTTTTEYCSGYTLVRVKFTTDGTSGNVPTYDGQPMFKIKKVDKQTAYGTTATSTDYFYVVKTADYAADKVSYAKATAEPLEKTGDTNGSGTVDINDAQFVYNLYNAFSVSYIPTAKQLLAADVNGDGIIDIQDCAAVIAKILK